MQIIQIDLSSVDKVRRFVDVLSKLEGDFDLVSGYHILDAHSLMGIFGFDLRKPIDLWIHEEEPDRLAEILEALAPFRTQG